MQMQSSHSAAMASLKTFFACQRKEERAPEVPSAATPEPSLLDAGDYPI